MDWFGRAFLALILSVMLSISVMAMLNPWHEEFECVGLGKFIIPQNWEVSDAKGYLGGECIYTEEQNGLEVCFYCNKRIKVWVRE